MKIDTIVVPTDLSDASEPAIREATEFARLTGARIVLLHVIDLIYYDYGWIYEGIPIPKDMIVKRESEISEQLMGLMTDDEKEGLEIDIEIVYGQPFQAILDVAKDKDADMIVMGTHGRRGLSHLFLGSVAEKVVRLAECPVLAVKAKAEKPKTDNEAEVAATSK